MLNPDQQHRVNSDQHHRLNSDQQYRLNSDQQHRVNLDQQHRVNSDQQHRLNSTSNTESTRTSNTESTRTSNTDSSRTSNKDSTRTSNTDSTLPATKTQLDQQHRVNSDQQHRLNSDQQHRVNSDQQHRLNSDQQQRLKSDQQHRVNSDQQQRLNSTSNTESTRTSNTDSTRTSNTESTRTSSTDSTRTSNKDSNRTSNTESTLPATKTQLGPATQTQLGPATQSQLGPATQSQLGPATKTQLGPATQTQLGPAIQTQLGPATQSQLGPATQSQLGPATQTQLYQQHRVNSDQQHRVNSDQQHRLISDQQQRLNSDQQHRLNSTSNKDSTRPATQSQLGPATQTQLGPATQSQLGPATQTQLGPATKTQIGPATQTQLGPAIQTQLGPATQSQLGPATQSQLGPATQSQLGPATQSQLGPATQSQLGPTQLGLATKTQLGPATKTQLGPATQTQLGPAIQTQLGPATQSQLGPATQTQLGPAIQTQLGPATKTQLGPATKTQLGPATQTQLGPATQSQLGPATQSQLGPATQTQLGPATQTQLGPATQTQLGPATQSQLGPATQSQLGPATQTQLGPATQTHLGPATLTQLGPATQSQLSFSLTYCKPSISKDDGSALDNMIKHTWLSNLLCLFASLTLAMVCVVTAKNSKDHTDRYKRVCYYTNWSQYRRDQGKFLPTDIDPHLCTHLIFAFAKIDKGVLAPYEWNDLQYPFLYKQFNTLKEKNPRLKTLLAVGGWTHGSQPFTEMVTSKSSRQKFIQHAIDYLRIHGFDGLDLDWEYPANRGSPAADKERFTFLVQELREAFEVESKKSGKDRLLLTAAVAGGERLANSGYEVKILNKYIDFFNLMSYDLHGSWSPIIGHHAPLIGGEKWMESKGDSLSVEQSVNLWLKLGADPSKIVMGLALYGKTFKLCNKGFEPGDKSCGSANPDTLNYYEILQKLKSGKYEKKWMDNEVVPYAYSPSEKLWVGYDDEESIRAKVKFAKKKNLGGVMVWAIDGDDFSGKFGDGVKYPLMNVIRDSIEGIKDDVLKHATNMKLIKEKSEETSKNISSILIDSASINNQQKLNLDPKKKDSTDNQTSKTKIDENVGNEQINTDKSVNPKTKTSSNNIEPAISEPKQSTSETIKNKPTSNSTRDEKVDAATFINSPVIIKKLPAQYSELDKELFEKPMAVPLHANLLAGKQVSSSTLVKKEKSEHRQKNIAIHNTAVQLRQRLKQNEEGTTSSQSTITAVSQPALTNEKLAPNVKTALSHRLTQRARGLQKKDSQTKSSSSVFSPPKETIYQYPTFVKYSSKTSLKSDSLTKDATLDRESDVPWFTGIKSLDNNKIDETGDRIVSEIKTKLKRRPSVSHPKNDIKIVPFSKSVGQIDNDKRVEDIDLNDKSNNELIKVVERKNPSFGRYVTLFPEEVEGWRTTVMAGTGAPEWVSRLMVENTNTQTNEVVDKESDNLLTLNVHSLDKKKEDPTEKQTEDLSQKGVSTEDDSTDNISDMESYGGKVFVKAMRPSSVHLQKVRSKSPRRNYLPTPYKSLSPFASQNEKLSRSYEKIPKISKYSRFNEEEMANLKQSHLKPNLKYQKNIQSRRAQELDKIQNNIEIGANKWWEDPKTKEEDKINVETVSNRPVIQRKALTVDESTGSVPEKSSSTNVGLDNPRLTRDGLEKRSSTNGDLEKLSSTNDGPDKLSSKNDRSEKNTSTNDGPDKLSSKNDRSEKLSYTNDGPEKLSSTNDSVIVATIQKSADFESDSSDILGETNGNMHSKTEKKSQDFVELNSYLHKETSTQYYRSTRNQEEFTTALPKTSSRGLSLPSKAQYKNNQQWWLVKTTTLAPGNNQNIKSFKKQKFPYSGRKYQGDIFNTVHKEMSGLTETHSDKGNMDISDVTTDKTSSGHGDVFSDKTSTGSGDVSSDKTSTGSGDVSSDKTSTGSGDVSSDKTSTGSGDVSSDKTSTGSGDVSPDKTSTGSGDVSPDKSSTGSGDVSSDNGEYRQTNDKESGLTQQPPVEVKSPDQELKKEMDKDINQGKTNITQLTLEPILIAEKNFDAETLQTATGRFPDSQPYHSKLTLQTFKHNPTPEKIYHYRHSSGQNDKAHGHQKVKKLAENEIPHNEVSQSPSINSFTPDINNEVFQSPSISSFTPDIKDWTKIRNLLRNSTVVAEIKSKLDEIHKSVTRDLTTQLPTEAPKKNDVSTKSSRHSGKWYERKNGAAKTITEQTSSASPTSKLSTIHSNEGAIKPITSDSTTNEGAVKSISSVSTTNEGVIKSIMSDSTNNLGAIKSAMTDGITNLGAIKSAMTDGITNLGAIKSAMTDGIANLGAIKSDMIDGTTSGTGQHNRDSKQSIYTKSRELQDDSKQDVIQHNINKPIHDNGQDKFKLDQNKDMTTPIILQEESMGKTKDLSDISAVNTKLQWWEQDKKSNGKYPETSSTGEESNRIYPNEPLQTSHQVKDLKSVQTGHQVKDLKSVQTNHHVKDLKSEKFSSEKGTGDLSNKSNVTSAANSRGTSQIGKVVQRYGNDDVAIRRVLKNSATISQYPVTKSVVKPGIMKGLREFQRPKNYNGYVVNNYKREGLRKNSAANAYSSNLYSGSVENSSKLPGNVSKLMTAYGLKDSSKIDHRLSQTNTNVRNEPFQAKNTMMIEIVTQPGQTRAYDLDDGHTTRVTGSPENSFRYKTVKNTGNFSCPSTFGIYADSKDCRKFYQCVWYVAFHHMCGRGTAWNQEDRICDWPKRTDCLLSTEESAN
ncbi:hypothetical protein Btru_055795 [Bulinus truncatus]|nr:hypothetical protein Btru_055795 [Bulinus truncatus]